ncbi:hypothetical protein G6F31_019941 [Rhizopus arrhizus]|nr:hypothetical protein G6F31_019941 [Rhizopus arrhizus]
MTDSLHLVVPGRTRRAGRTAAWPIRGCHRNGGDDRAQVAHHDQPPVAACAAGCTADCAVGAAAFLAASAFLASSACLAWALRTPTPNSCR